MKIFLVLALGSLYAAAADVPVREVTSLAARVGHARVPAFQNDYLFFLDHANARLYAPQGYPAFVAVLQVPKDLRPQHRLGLHLKRAPLQTEIPFRRVAGTGSGDNGMARCGTQPGPQLMGADGTRLVFSRAGTGPISLEWFPQPASQPI